MLFSGGKDSVFATYRACEKNDVACLITLIAENEDSYMFHTPNIRRSSVIAEAMGIPQISWPTRGEEETELEDLTDAIRAARDIYGIEGVVTGAIESVYQASRVQRICRDLDLWCFNPIWQINQVDYLRQLILKGFRIIITGVSAYPIDGSWLGEEITEDIVMKLEILQSRYRINPSGEGGELETFVLDGPNYRRSVEILNATVSYKDYRGRFIIEDLRLVDK